MPRGFVSRVDGNQAEIVMALKAIGCGVIDTSGVGRGCPDLIVGFRGSLHLLEVKNPNSKYGQAGLNKRQAEWHEQWAGCSLHVVRTIDEALSAIGAVVERAEDVPALLAGVPGGAR